MRQEVAEAVANISAVSLCAQNLELTVRAELGKELSARAAGHAVVFALGIDCNAQEIGAALADSLDASGALGADCIAKRGIFDVAAGEKLTVAALDYSTDGKLGIGYVCSL